MDVRVGPQRRLSAKELMLLNCGIGEDLRVPWTARRSNQSILKENSPEYSLEGLMLKLQYFGHLMQELTYWKRPWCWERLNWEEKGMIEVEMVGWHHWLSGHEVEQTPRNSEGQGGLVCCSPWGHRVRHDWATEQQKREGIKLWVEKSFRWMQNSGGTKVTETGFDLINFN